MEPQKRGVWLSTLENWNVNEACIGAAGLSKVDTAEPIKTRAGDPSNLLPSLCGS